MLQPLQALAADGAAAAAELDKCLAVLRAGPGEDAIEVMKLLCYEMMDLARSQAAAAAAAGGEAVPPSDTAAAAVWSLLCSQVDALVAALTTQTQQVRRGGHAVCDAGHLRQL